MLSLYMTSCCHIQQLLKTIRKLDAIDDDDFYMKGIKNIMIKIFELKGHKFCRNLIKRRLKDAALNEEQKYRLKRKIITKMQNKLIENITIKKTQL